MKLAEKSLGYREGQAERSLAAWLKRAGLNPCCTRAASKDAMIYFSRAHLNSHPGEKIPQGTMTTAIISCDESP